MRQLSQCLNPKLAEIIERVMALQNLNTIIIDYLPQQLRAHFSVGSFNKGCLVLVTSDPTWASQLRYHLPELRNTLRIDAEMYQLASIKITVSADNLKFATKPQQKLPPLSTKARETILAESEQCQYEPLKEALKQLATSIQKQNL